MTSNDAPWEYTEATRQTAAAGGNEDGEQIMSTTVKAILFSSNFSPAMLRRRLLSTSGAELSDNLGNLSTSVQWPVSPPKIIVAALNDTKVFTSYKDLELLSSNWQIFLIILYTLTAALALFGNIISIWVIVSGKRSSKELRLFLVNLSLSDITMAIFSIPFTYTHFMFGRWIFAPAFCPIVQLMQMTSVFVSVYTLIIIGIDRYIAILYPLISNRIKRSFGLLTILIVWVCGFTLGFVQWFKTKSSPFLIANETNYDCKETWSEDESRHFTISVFIITFALPMAILMFVYGSVALRMFYHSTPGNADTARDRAQQNSKIKIIKMLATIVILFAICWLPIQILNLFIYFARNFMESIYNSQSGFNVYVTITITAHWLSMANSFVNPIIYCFSLSHFRSDLRFLWKKTFKKLNFCSIQQNHETYRSSTIKL